MPRPILAKTVRLFACAGCLAFLAVAGCIPVGWLPDSSGFVYTDGRNLQQLVHYDVAKGERRVLVEKLPATTTWPAVSPDGKRFAVARLSRDPNAKKVHAMQVIMYDLQGKEVHRSAEFPWTKEGKESEDETLAAGVFWIANAKKLIVHNYDDPVRTGIYDPEKKTMQVMDGYPSAFGGSPVRPDGKGFLLSVKDGDKTKVFVVDWDGKTQPIEMKNNLADSEDRESVLCFPWMGTSAWTGGVAEVSYRAIHIRIDTDKREGVYEPIPPAKAVIDGKEVIQLFTFADGATVRVLQSMRNSTAFYHVEFLKSGEKKPTELKVQEKDEFVLSPAPNGKYLAIRSFTNDKNILLVSQTGEVKEIAGNND